jgi:protease IV
MLAEVARSGAALLVSPVRAVTRLLRRSIMGRGRIVEIDVHALPDVRARAMFALRVRRLARDPAVVGVVLRVDSPPGGWGATGDLRDAIGVVRAAGKKVVAHLETPGNAAMWLASACDEIAIVPTGEISPLGIGAELTFFGAALERIGVRPDFEAAGAYKAFGEPFTRSFASAENREALDGLLGGLHDRLLDDLAAARGLDRAALEVRLGAGPLSPAEAIDAGLVDRVAYRDELDRLFVAEGQEPPPTLSFDAWARADFVESAIDAVGRARPAVAIVHLDGAIVLSRGNGSHIPTRRAVELLRALRADPAVRAVVLNISSPGGHALGSDLIWREVAKLAESRPVVAAYEDVSASGGVYLTAPARRIFARRGTITGSIGVFGGKLVVGEGMRRIGVHTQRIGPAGGAGYLSPSRPFTDVERARFRAHLQRFYDGFVERVAAGRGRSVAEIEPHCRGRVWTGDQAVARGLVDEIGDLRAAVAFARREAGLQAGSRVVHLSAAPRRSAVQWALRQAAPSGAVGAGGGPVEGALAAAAALAELVGAGAVQRLAPLLAEPGQPLALLPFELPVR